MMPSPPLRFLGIVLGGWICLRSAVLGSTWWAKQENTSAIAPSFARARPPVAETWPRPAEDYAPAPHPLLPTAGEAPTPALAAASTRHFAHASAHLDVLSEKFEMTAAQPGAEPSARSFVLPPPIAALRQGTRRWSASAWMFMRGEAAAGLAPGGSLGGSQAGGRLGFRLNGDPARPLSVSLRGYAPLDALRGTEIAAGVDWKPIAQLPVHLLLERRQAVGRDGRSDFAATGYGGFSDLRAGPLAIDAYAQAGVVGAKARDLFADGSIKFSLPAGGLKLGAGLWGAAQPGVSRVDVGPHVSFRLPANLTVAADWRQRVGGNAAPASGPTLTLSTDF